MKDRHSVLKDRHSVSKDLLLIGTIGTILEYATIMEEKKAYQVKGKKYLGTEMVLSTNVNIYTREQINSNRHYSQEPFNPEYYTGESEYLIEKNVYSININLNNSGKNTKIYLENHQKEDTYIDVLSAYSSFEDKLNFINSLIDTKAKARIFPSNNEYNLSNLEKENIHNISIDMLNWLTFRAKLEKDNKKSR